MLNENKLKIVCLDAVGNLTDYNNADKTVSEIESLICLAKDLNRPNIRPSRIYKECEEDGDDLDEKVIGILERVLPMAENAHITLLIESLGIYADTKRLSKTSSTILPATISPRSGIYTIHTSSPTRAPRIRSKISERTSGTFTSRTAKSRATRLFTACSARATYR
jgi:hypothetical protein